MKKQEPFPQPEAWWEHRVSYGETDAMGIVYYGNYLHWFEQARSHFIRERGMGYSEIEKQGVLLPVREVHCRYLAPATYEQEIMVRTGIGTWARASLTFEYQVYNLSRDRSLMTLGQTQHACVSPQGRPVPVPDWLKTLCS
ncbi:MAG: acyl-CoA thioesterase [Desulfohalobiaceae bacterium]|nr:acyl-CoA thioesterase [Desulfohalobiaceae bacterium]